jgi:hypothetical protein
LAESAIGQKSPFDAYVMDYMTAKPLRRTLRRREILRFVCNEVVPVSL